MPFKKLSVYWDGEHKTRCEECSTNEGKFILIADIGKTEKEQDFEREEYYCIDCFKTMMNS